MVPSYSIIINIKFYDFSRSLGILMDFKIVKESASEFIFQHYDKTLFIAFAFLACIIWICTIISISINDLYLIIFPISITIISVLLYLRVKTIEINAKENSITFYREYRGTGLRKVTKIIKISDITDYYSKTVKLSRKSVGPVYWLCLKLRNNEVELLYTTDNQNYFNSMKERMEPYLKLIIN